MLEAEDPRLIASPAASKGPVRRHARATWAAIALATAHGCAERDSIDARIARLVDARSAELSSTADVVRARGEAPLGRASTSRTPPTNNPPASALTYTPAKEARAASAALGAPATDAAPMRLTLTESWRQAQRTGRDLRNAEEDYILSAIRVLVQRHLWGPRLFNDTSVELAGAGDDGNFQHALEIVNTLRATKRLPSGGSVEAAFLVNATEQLRQQATGRYTQSSSLVLSGTVPLLRGAGDVAREDLIQAERDLVYAARTFERFRRQLLVDVANDFFALVQLKAQIVNQERQLESLKRLEQSTQARVQAGRLDAFQTAIASSRVLAAEASLRGQREAYTLQVDRFKVRLGLPPAQGVAVESIDLTIPPPAMDLEGATLAALEYRLDLQNRRDQIDDASRAIDNARNALLPGLDLSGRATLPTDPDDREGGVALSPDDASYSARVLLSLPLDREQERLALRSAFISLEQRRRQYEQERDNVVVGVRSALRSVGVATDQLDLAERQVEINRRRLEGQQLKADQVDPQVLVDSYNELLDAENNRDRALTDLRNAVLNFLLQSDQLRVARDGSFQALPGME